MCQGRRRRRHRSRWDGAASRDWRSQPPPTRRRDLSLKSCGRRTPFTSGTRGRWSGYDPPERRGRAPAVAAPMPAGDMGSAVPALLAISLILTAFLLGGALGLVDLPVKLRGGLAVAHAPAAPRRSAARTTAAAVSGAPVPGPELEALEAAEARVFVPVRCEIVCRSDSACSRFAVVGFGTDGTYVWLAESPRSGGGRSSGRAQPRRGGGPPAPHGPAHRAGLGAGRTWRSLVRSQVPTERAVWCLIMDRKSATSLSRADVLTTAMLAGAGVAAGGALLGGLADGAASQPSRKQDVEILNFALLLEELQAAFYADALQRGSLERRAAAVRRAGRRPGARNTPISSARRWAMTRAEPPAFDFGDATGDAEDLREDGAGARGPRRRRLQHAGAEPDQGRARCGGADRVRRGSSRGLDSRPAGREPRSDSRQSLALRPAEVTKALNAYGLPRVGEMSDLTLDHAGPRRRVARAARRPARRDARRVPVKGGGRRRRPARGAVALPATAAAAAREERHRDPELRARARVPPVVLLHRGRADGGLQGKLRASRHASSAATSGRTSVHCRRGPRAPMR